jgi:amino acid transporter
MSNQQLQSKSLRPASIGVAGIVFFVVAAAGPMAAALGASPVVFATAGDGAPAMFLTAAVILLLFAVGFAAMSRFVTSAGGFAALAARGLGKPFGFAAAGVAILAYAGMLIGLYGSLAIFTAELLATFFGIEAPWFLVALIWALVVGVLAHFDVRLSAAVLGVLLILEVVMLLIFDVAVFASGGASGITFDAFLPSNFITPNIGVALLFAFACFVGFEATTIYGEEAKNPKKTVAVATYVSIGVIGIFYTLTTWAVQLSYGQGLAGEAATVDPVGFIFAKNTEYVGEWSTFIIQILVVTSIFAVILSFQNTLSRYFFSLGRAHFLPVIFGKTQERFRSPSVANITLSVITILVLGIFAIAGADPFANVYLWLVGLGTLGILILQALGAASVVGFFARNRSGTNAWVAFIAPTLGGIGLLVGIILAIVNFDALSGAVEGPATLLPWLMVIAAGLGVVIGAIRVRRGVSIDLQVDFDQAQGPLDESKRIEQEEGTPR